MASIALQWNRLAEARDYLDQMQAARLSRGLYRTMEVAMPLLRAQVFRARGELGAAGDALDEAERAARRQATPHWQRLAVAVVVAAHRPDLAGEWKRQRPNEGPRSMVATLGAGSMPATVIKTTDKAVAAKHGK